MNQRPSNRVTPGAGIIEGVTIPGVNDAPPPGSVEAAPATSPDPATLPDAVPVVKADRDLIQAARLQARHRQANRAQSVAEQDSIPGYTIKRELHRGGQGVVYLAVCDATQRKVAIKVIREGALASDTQRDRFEREIQVLAQLRHPGIVTVIDSGRVDGSAYLVMDYIEGADLGKYADRTGLSVEDTLRVFLNVCEAVKAAHVRGVIHRDLKPSNIMVDGAGVPHVLDFGLAKLGGGATETGVSDSANTQTGQFVGSLPFASPEQARGETDKIDVRTDVYSLGVILYRILTGTFPYPVEGSITEIATHIDRTEPERASRHRAEVPEQLDIILIRALAKSRSRRYQSVSELAADVERLLLRESIDAKRDGTLYLMTQVARRHRLATAAALAAVVTLVLTSAVFGLRLSDRNAQLEAVLSERDELRERVERLENSIPAPREARLPSESAAP